MGLSLGQIITLLAIFLPNGTGPSRATVGRWVSQASRQAGDLLALLDHCCQRWVLVLCLDEIFFHREPILMAVEPHSMAWVAGQRGPDRSGESWCELLAHWPCVERVIADAGKGLERGVKLSPGGARSGARRRGGGETARDGPRRLSYSVRVPARPPGKWRQAERGLEAAAKADAKVARTKRVDTMPAACTRQAWWAWRKAERLFDEAVQAEAAAQR